MPICIYCLVEKKASEFNVEHVLTKAFGIFENNLTLVNKVCTNCNQLFGDTIDLALARNSLAGIQRYVMGIKPAKEFKPYMAKSLTITLGETNLERLPLNFEYCGEANNLVVVPVHVVGLKRKSGEHQFFNLASIPHIAVISDTFNLNDHDSICIPPLVDPDLAVKALKEKGIFFNLRQIEEVKINKTVSCKVTEQLDILKKRAIYKIAFNYLAMFNSTEAVAHHMFDPSRDFILHGADSYFIDCVFEHDPTDFINTLGNVHYHTTCITRTGPLIIGHVYLHPSFRYAVLLAIDDPSNKLRVNHGHMFDVKSRAIVSFE